jgi:hypothetical protein
MVCVETGSKIRVCQAISSVCGGGDEALRHTAAERHTQSKHKQAGLQLTLCRQGSPSLLVIAPPPANKHAPPWPSPGHHSPNHMPKTTIPYSSCFPLLPTATPPPI